MPNFDSVQFQTARLLLRPPQDSDAAAIFAMRADPEMNQYTGLKPWPAIESAHQVIAADRQAMALGERLRLAITLHGKPDPIGTISVWAIDAECRRAEIGYVLMRQWWGHGYMHEALTAVIQFAFTEMNLNRFEADIDPGNAASLKLLERLGFQREGLLRERWIIDGVKADTVLLGLLAADWQRPASTT